MELVWIAPGEFTMGNPSTEGGHDRDELQHRVTIGKGFWMGEYEVTQEQYQAVMGRHPSHFKGPRNPVETVSWEEAVSFSRKLNGMGVLQQGMQCRLPTEAEWEYACRAGTTTVFHCRNSLPSSRCSYGGFRIVVAVAAIASPGAEKQGDLSAFLGKPLFDMQQLFRNRGGRNIIAAGDGTVLAFHRGTVRRSADGGKTWSDAAEIGPDARGNAIVDEKTGRIMLVAPQGHRWISEDAGLTWTREEIKVLPNKMGHGSSERKDLDANCMQQGVTLQFGKHKGRLIMPVRWSPSNALMWRPVIYNTAIYSDDGGKTWQTTNPFPVLGTGEAALAEISDGRILYSSREHMSRGNRFFAWSHDGGDRWLNFWRSEILPDGARGTSYGCMGGLIRLPVKGRDILVYSNLDTGKGVMPPIEEAGASRGRGREKITVWASFDGGETWPLKRLVFDGPSAYSNLGVGRHGTASEGRIYLSFEGGKEGMYSGIQVATFNLAWMLGGEETGHGEVPEWVREN